MVHEFASKQLLERIYVLKIRGMIILVFSHHLLLLNFIVNNVMLFKSQSYKNLHISSGIFYISKEVWCF